MKKNQSLLKLKHMLAPSFSLFSIRGPIPCQRGKFHLLVGSFKNGTGYEITFKLSSVFAHNFRGAQVKPEYAGIKLDGIYNFSF